MGRSIVIYGLVEVQRSNAPSSRIILLHDHKIHTLHQLVIRVPEQCPLLP